jgi:hypothetical protein
MQQSKTTHLKAREQREKEEETRVTQSLLWSPDLLLGPSS